MEKKDLGAQSAAAVEGAGSIDTPQLTHVAHTPGEWTVHHDFDDGLYRVVLNDNDPGQCVIAEMEAQKEERANAHLIAAAPELKDALRDRVWAEHDSATHWPAGSTRYGHSGEFETCPHRDCRLIAKAEGRS